jgi:hypothetical protein
MSGGIFRFRNYLIISILASLVVFIIGQAAGPQISAGLTTLKGAAMGVGMSNSLASIVTEPLRAAFTGGVPAALIAGFLWPISGLWLVFIFLLFFFATLGSGFDTAAGTIRS